MDFNNKKKFSSCFLGKSKEELEIFFEKLALEENEQEFYFYDLILPERNIYYPACLLYALYFRVKIGNKKYEEYMQAGAMYGILEKYGYSIISSEIKKLGAFSACIARKKNEETQKKIERM